MSDFLGNLVGRSLGLAEIVRPRVATLFEPPPAGVTSLAGRFDGRSRDEGEGAAPPMPAAIESSDSVQPASASFRKRDAHERDRAPAIAPAPSDPSRGPTESLRSAWAHRPLSLEADGDAVVHSGEPAIRPAVRVRDRLSVSPTSAMRRDQAAAGGRSDDDASATPLAVVPEDSDGGKIPARRTAIASHRPPGSPWPAGGSNTERDDDGRLHDFLSAVPSSVVLPPGREPRRRSGLDAFAAQPAHRRGRVSRGETATWGEPARPVNVDPRASLDLGSSGVPSPDERGSRPDPGPAGPATVVVQPRVTLYSAPVDPARPRTEVQTEPTIQVTIGRVEVRATRPPTPVASRERPSTPVMSLEEYLRRRAEESAR